MRKIRGTCSTEYGELAKSLNSLESVRDSIRIPLPLPLRNRHRSDRVRRRAAVLSSYIKCDPDIRGGRRVGDVPVSKLALVERNGLRNSGFRDFHDASVGFRNGRRFAIPANLQLMRPRNYREAQDGLFAGSCRGRRNLAGRGPSCRRGGRDRMIGIRRQL